MQQPTTPAVSLALAGGLALLLLLGALLEPALGKGLRTELRALLDPKKTEWAGAGGNAYVIRFLKTDRVAGIDRGYVAKAFQDKDARDDAYRDLLRVPKLKVLSGLAYPERTKDESNIFEGNCVHVKRNYDCCGTWNANQRCYFLALDNAGSVTMEQCFRQQPSHKNIKYTVLAALDALRKIHKAGWSHNDYQLKNIMLGDHCHSQDLMVVDIDGMSQRGSRRGVRMLRDVALLMGVCDAGAFSIDSTEMLPGADQKAKNMASRIYELANNAMHDHCGSLNTASCVDGDSDESCEAAVEEAKQLVDGLRKSIQELR